MKKINFLILFISIFFITGCYNYRELNDLAIMSAIGVDKTEDGYKATIQIINTQKNGSDSNTSTEQPKFVTFSREDKTLQEALRKIILESSKRIYADHAQILVIGSDLAEEGIYNILDFFFRNSESRKQFQVVVAKDCTAYDMLNVITPLETLNSKHMQQGISNDSRYLGVGEVISFEKLVDSYIDQNKEIVLPSFIIKGDKKDGDNIDNLRESNSTENVVQSSLAIFKDDKLLGFLDEDESIDLSFIRNNISNTILSYKCGDDSYIVSEIIDTKTDVSIDTDPLTFKINISGTLNLNEITCDLDITNLKVISEIEDNLENELKSRINNTIDKIIDEYDTDVFGFRDILYKSNPKYYHKINDDWYDSVFKNMNFDINVKFKFIEKGNSLKVIKK